MHAPRPAEPPAPPRSSAAGLLLTGGRSRRMGRDKAALEVDGEPLAMRTARLLASVCAPALEVGPGRSSLAVVPEDDPQGPLAAVAAGWRALLARGHDGPVVVVAVDLPRLEPGLLRFLATHPAPGSVVPVVAGRAQPLCARWSPTACTLAVELVAAGRRAVLSALDAADRAGDVTWCDEASWGRWAAPGALADVDTPADLARLGVRP